MTRRSTVAALVAVTALLAAACSTDEQSGGGAGRIDVTSTDDACDLSSTEAEAGNIVFTVTNKGSQVTEFYLYEEDGTAIASEIENIGPGISRDMVVTVDGGKYVTACKPGMTGDGLRGDFTVTGEAAPSASGSHADLAAVAVAQYADYVAGEVEALVAQTQEFASLYVDGKDDEARALYAPARMHWEAVEPVAESFGDLDPRLDLREADLEEGQAWTGWHAIEKDLWPPADGYTARTAAERQALADQLVADTEELQSRIATLELTTAQLGNGAKELLDEVATGKVTGEEEAWSHTDLWDFMANVQGANEAFAALKPIAAVKDPELTATLTARFQEVFDLLATYSDGDGGFVTYDQLSEDDVRQLADAVNALGEPLSQLTAVVVL